MKQVAVITGASSGIGLELARLHAQHGGDCILVARRDQRLREICEDLQRDYGIEARHIVADLASAEAPRMIQRLLRDWGVTVEVLINNAGFGGAGAFHSRDAEVDQAMIDVNIRALVELTRLFLRDMLARKQGRILQVASTAGLVPGGANLAVYSASKAFVVSFSRALWQECRGSGVSVTVLCPGATATEFAQVADTSDTAIFQNPADPRVVAEAGYRGMRRGKRVVVAGLTRWQRLQMALLPLLPERYVLAEVQRLQSP